MGPTSNPPNRLRWLAPVALVLALMAVAEWGFRIRAQLLSSRREIIHLNERLAAESIRLEGYQKRGAVLDGHAPRLPPAAAAEDAPGLVATGFDPLQRAIFVKEAEHQFSRGIAKLHLPPEKLVPLKRLLGETTLSSLDASEAARNSGLEESSPAFVEAIHQANADVEKQIVALVGADGWATLQASRNLSNYIGTIRNSYDYDFDEAGIPLAPDQETSLAQAMADNERASVFGGVASSNRMDPETGLKPSDTRLLTSVAGSLSTQQLAVLKASLAEQNRFSKAYPGQGNITSVVSVETVEVDSDDSSGPLPQSAGP